jgi:hypothetical protein
MSEVVDGLDGRGFPKRQSGCGPTFQESGSMASGKSWAQGKEIKPDTLFKIFIIHRGLSGNNTLPSLDHIQTCHMRAMSVLGQ